MTSGARGGAAGCWRACRGCRGNDVSAGLPARVPRRESIAAFIADHLSVRRGSRRTSPTDERMLLLVEEVLRPGESSPLGYAMLVFADPSGRRGGRGGGEQADRRAQQVLRLPDRHGGGVAAPLMAAVLAAATPGSGGVRLARGQPAERPSTSLLREERLPSGRHEALHGRSQRHDDFVLERRALSISARAFARIRKRRRLDPDPRQMIDPVRACVPGNRGPRVSSR